MVILLIILTVIFIAMVFYVAQVVVLHLEQRAEADSLRTREAMQKFILEKNKAHTEKLELEREANQIFTLYEMTKDISRHFNEQEAFNIFRKKLKENITIEDCQLVDDLGLDQKDQSDVNEHSIFILKSKEKRLGYLVYKGVPAKDMEKFVILAHQFALALRRIKLYHEIETMAITDGLTGVYTRRYFTERFDEEVKRSQLRKSKLSFLILDVDHFKMINDQHGHLTGDQVLKSLGDIIKENVREIDIAGRYGGEEFCVVLPDTDQEGARLVAERIRVATEQRIIKAYDATIHITISIGLSCFPADGKSPDELIDKADWSLYRAKSQGRNCVVAFGTYHHK